MEIVNIEFHYGGRLVGDSETSYEGGMIHSCPIELDKLSYFELKGNLKDVGLTNVGCMFYKIPRCSLDEGLLLIENDKDCQKMLEDCGVQSGVSVVIEVYTVEKHFGDRFKAACVDVDEYEEDCYDNDSVGSDGESDGNIGFEKDEGEESDGNIAVEKVEGEESDGKIGVEKDEGEESDGNVGVEKDEGEESDDNDSVANSLEFYTSDDEEVIKVRKRKYTVDKDNTEDKDTTEDKDNTEGNNNEGATFVDSDEGNSSNMDSPFEDTDSEGENNATKSPIFPSYNPNSDPWEFIPHSRVRFGSCEQLKDLLKYYAVKHGYPLKFPRCNTHKLEVVCGDGCPWRLWASTMQSEDSFQIKSLKSEHKCSRAFVIRIAGHKFWANVYKRRILSNPHWKLIDMRREIVETYGVDVSIHQCYNIKRAALARVEGSLRDHYKKLWDYAGELLLSNPGSTVKVKMAEDLLPEFKIFQRVYVCFAAIKENWRVGCRAVLGLDGAFLKGYVKGMLLTAVGRDGNDQMYPVAWAVVESENKDSWKWFIEMLMDDLGYEQGHGLTIISDQQKGLVPAIAEVVPLAEHRLCARHIYANLRKQFKNVEIKYKFWQVCKCGTTAEFDKLMVEIKELSVGAYNYLMEHSPQTWCRAFFSLFSTCDSVENNMSETFNSVMVEARGKPLISLLEDIRVYCMSRLSKRRDLVNSWSGVCPRIMQKVEKEKKHHRYWTPTYSGERKFEVRHGDFKDGFVVDLGKRTCSCRLWEISGLPCRHAISAIYYKHEDPLSYVAKCYTVEEARKAYQQLMQPVNGENLWPKSPLLPLDPPLDRRMPGRPKKQRNKDKDEEKKTRVEVERTGRKMSCGKCKGIGHNKKTCTAIDDIPSKKSSKKETPKKRISKKKTPKKKISKKETPKNSAKSIVCDNVPQSITKPKRKERTPAGYGLYVSEKTGDSYFREPGAKRGKWFKGKTGPSTQESASTKVVPSTGGPSLRTRSVGTTGGLTKVVPSTGGPSLRTRSVGSTGGPSLRTRSKGTIS